MCGGDRDYANSMSHRFKKCMHASAIRPHRLYPIADQTRSAQCCTCSIHVCVSIGDSRLPCRSMNFLRCNWLDCVALEAVACQCRLTLSDRKAIVWRVYRRVIYAPIFACSFTAAVDCLLMCCLRFRCLWSGVNINAASALVYIRAMYKYSRLLDRYIINIKRYVYTIEANECIFCCIYMLFLVFILCHRSHLSNSCQMPK